MRNVGVVAHIDAGKTSLTERLLFLAGETRLMGSVDEGTTVTDYLEVERERGITINSAVVTLHWNDHCIHLVDTPGHVDFGVEVERCLRVLDGLLVVIDAAAGVQAQTRFVWKQASKFRLPSVFFINKMDKPNADFAASVDSIEQKLGTKAVPVVVPHRTKDGDILFVDLINSRFISLNEGVNGKWREIKKKGQTYECVLEGRENLLLGMSDVDKEIGAMFFEDAKGKAEDLNESTIMHAVRRLSLSQALSFVACGSALHSPESALSCLHLAMNCLPSPQEKTTKMESIFDGNLAAFVFKIFSVQSDTLEKKQMVSAGELVVLKGMEKATTGDTILASEATGEEAALKMVKEGVLNAEAESLGLQLHQNDLIFHGISEPEPVFYCSVEPPSLSGKHALERALSELVVEDPSLKIREDPDSGQTIIETMGELHMEIVKDRLVRGYGLNVFIGPLQVAYREMCRDTVKDTATVEETIAGRTHSATLTLRLEPTDMNRKWKSVRLLLPAGSKPLRADWVRALNVGVLAALHNGPLLGLPVQAVDVVLCDFHVSGGKISGAIISSAAHKCVEACLKASQPCLLEPVMSLDLEVLGDFPLHPLLHELASRRATVHNVGAFSPENACTMVSASIPLSSLPGLSGSMRTLSRGMANLHVRLEGYREVDEQEQAHLIMARRRV